MIRAPKSAVVSGVRAVDSSGEVILELQTGSGPRRERVSFQLGRASVDVLADALPQLRDGKIQQVEADDLDEDGWAI